MKYIKLFEELHFVDKIADENQRGSFLMKGDSFCRLFDDDQNHIGNLHFRIKEDVFHIVWIDVLDKYQGKKYGSYIMNNIIERAKEKLCKTIELQVLNSNSIAINLYNKFGFDIKEVDGFYWIMELSI